MDPKKEDETHKIMMTNTRRIAMGLPPMDPPSTTNMPITRTPTQGSPIARAAGPIPGVPATKGEPAFSTFKRTSARKRVRAGGKMSMKKALIMFIYLVVGVEALALLIHFLKK
jgi:hypothetical protein